MPGCFHCELKKISLFVLKSFNLSEIIKDYQPHTADELAQFKEELWENSRESILYSNVSADVGVVSNLEELRIQHRGSPDIYDNEEVIMGIQKDNGFVTLCNNSRGIFGNCAYGSDEGNKYDLDFTYEGIQYLNSLSYEERELFLLEFYLSVMDTDEAIGIVYTDLYWSEFKGDVNGDGKINAIDNIELVNFIIGNSSGVIYGNCDVNDDGKITTKDAFYIKKLVVGC